MRRSDNHGLAGARSGLARPVFEFLHHLVGEYRASVKRVPSRSALPLERAFSTMLEPGDYGLQVMREELIQ